MIDVGGTDASGLLLLAADEIVDALNVIGACERVNFLIVERVGFDDSADRA